MSRSRLAQPRRCHPATLAIVLVAVGIGGLALPCAAQESRLSRSRLIEGLAERNMALLLGHYLEQVEDELDPVERQTLRAQQALMTYYAGVGNIETRTEAVEALGNAIRTQVELIKSNPDHRMRPMWQTDLAELLLIQQVGNVGNRAELFYEFGIPNNEQREVFHDAVLTAYVMSNQSYEGFDALRGQMGRQPEIRRELEESGVLYSLERYQDILTPLFLAHAAYYMTLLPDNHPYYADITAGRPNPDVPARASSIALERARLLEDAMTMVEPFARDAADPYGVRKAAMSLAGRISNGTKDFGAAVDMLTPVVADAAIRETVLHLGASLALAYAEAGEAQFGEALDRLGDMESHPLVAATPTFRLLVADATHRILLQDIGRHDAAQQQLMLPTAYEPYFNMLNALPEAERPQWQGYIFVRWEASIPPDANITTYPAMVRLAVAELARSRAEESVSQAIAGSAGADATKLDEARAHFDRAIEAGESLTGEDVPPAIRARGMMSLGWSILRKEEIAEDGQNIAAMFRGIDILLEVADKHHTEPVAADAITIAANYANTLHVMSAQQPIPGAEAVYERVGQVLFTKHDNTPVAENQRVYFAQTMLQNKGKLAEAVEMYGKVRVDSDWYFPALVQRLFTLEILWLQSDAGASREFAAQTLLESAEALADEGQRTIDQARNPQRVTEATRAVAVSRLVRAALATAARDYEAAIAVLDGFEEDYPNEPEYTSMAIERRINAFVAANRLDEAAAAARQMMTDFPDSAAFIINKVLETLEQEIDSLTSRAEATQVAAQKQEFITSRTQRAAVAVTLSEVLLEWAKVQGFDDEQMLSYRLPVIKALRLSGQAQEAVTRIEPLSKQYPQNGLVLTELADAYYAVGDEQSLRAARPIYIRLVQGLERDKGPGYWHAWVRVLSIADLLNEGADKIVGRVRMLRAQIDQNLGGPEFKSKLEALEAKHAARGN